MSGARRIAAVVAAILGVSGVIAIPSVTSALQTAMASGEGHGLARLEDPARFGLPPLEPAPTTTATETSIAPPVDDVAIAPPPDSFDGEPERAEPLAIEAVASSRTAEVFAVVIGIDDYPGSNGDLTAAVADARDARAALLQFGVPETNILSVTNRQASAGGLASAVRWLVESTGPEDTAVFFYAGHVRKLSRTREAVLTADGVETTDEQLAVMFAPLGARRAWIVIAACYGGGFTELLAPGRVLTAAASASRLAYENRSYGRSYLVEYMIRRAWLERRAPGSVEEAFDYAAAALRRDHPDRVPFQIDHADGLLTIAQSGALRVATAPATDATPPAPRPQPDSDPSPPPPDGGDDDDGCGAISLFCRR